MKLNLLLATSLITGAAFGQFTQANEPSIGDSKTMYVVDSNYTDYAAATGTGVTWNYSSIGTYPTPVTKYIDVITPASPFGSADFGIEIPGFVTGYYTSTAAARTCIGFTFQEPSIGAIDVVLSTNNELVMNYPFGVNGTLTDAFSGTADTPLGAIPLTGNVNALVDGSGTLQLQGTTISNVLRYKIIETATANAGPFGTIQMDRIQYEYYDLANSDLPVFIHSTLTITSGGSATTQKLVLSSVLPTGTAAVAGNSSADFGMYPNPANESLTFSGLSGNESISIVDMAGKTVLTAQAGSQTVNISDIDAGIYNVVVVSNGNKTVKKLTVN